MSEISVLLYILEDPFNVFPLQSVCKELGNLVNDTYGDMAERSGWWGVSPKYRSVEDEHDLEMINLFIGSAFVLGQATITQAVSIVRKLRDFAGEPSWLPKEKNSIMSMEANIHPATGISKIILFDAIANYFKHHYEWPKDWKKAKATQQSTIDIVLTLGLVPESENNLDTALRNLNMSTRNMSAMGHEIQEWRERLASNIQKQLVNHGLY